MAASFVSLSWQNLGHLVAHISPSQRVAGACGAKSSTDRYLVQVNIELLGVTAGWLSSRAVRAVRAGVDDSGIRDRNLDRLRDGPTSVFRPLKNSLAMKRSRQRSTSFLDRPSAILRDCPSLSTPRTACSSDRFLQQPGSVFGLVIYPLYSLDFFDLSGLVPAKLHESVVG